MVKIGERIYSEDGAVLTMPARMLLLITWVVFLALGFMVFSYAPWLLLGVRPATAILIGVGLSAATLGFGVSLRRLSLDQTEVKRPGYALAFILIFGVVLRFVWVYAVPPVQFSDMIDYWQEAARWVETGVYAHNFGEHVWYAWRPPGYSAFLSACMMLVGANEWIPAVTNTCFYVLTSLGSYSIAKQIAGDRTGLFTVSLLTIWPSYVAMTGLALTEVLLMLLLVASLWTFLMWDRNRDGWFYAAMTGLLTGLGALVRSTFLGLVFLWIIFALMRPTHQSSLRGAAIALVFTVLVVMPWTIRNYLTLGSFVVISTNGGSVFYRANNPLASGGYTPYGERDLDAYIADEVTHDRMGYAWGKEWIWANPLEFFKLAIKKQAILLGESTTGVYGAVERGHNDTGFMYKLLLAISHFWWLSVWVLAVIGTMWCRWFFTADPRGGMMLWVILYFVFVHSVFESQPRYHVPIVAILSVISSLAIYPPRVVLQKNGRSIDR